MKQFFNRIVDVFKSLFNKEAVNHHKWLIYGSLCLVLLFDLIFGAVASILLTCCCALFAEACYCFVPFKSVNWGDFWFKIPDFKEFRNDVESYITKPQHDFVADNYYYVLAGISIFVVLKILFLIF